MYKIDILMATYNGASYIHAQLSSLVSQSFTDWRLLVHDDGSTDDTVSIVESWAEKDSRIVLIEDDVRCGGAAKNFLYLTQFSDAPYCMFCDQDDIWFDNKVEILYNAIVDAPINIPVAAYGRSYLWKPDIGIVGVAGWNSFPHNLKQFICGNGGIQGCSAICNHCAIRYLQNYNGRVAMHDHLLNLVVLVWGHALSVSTPLMLYRQHSANVTGSSPLTLPIYKRIWRSLRRTIPVIERKHYNAIGDFYQKYEKEIIDIEKRKDFETYLAMPNYSRLCKIRTVISSGWTRNNSMFQLVLKILIHPYIN